MATLFLGNVMGQEASVTAPLPPGALLAPNIGHPGAVVSLTFAPNGRTVASSSRRDNKVRVWEAATGKLLHTLEGHTRYVQSVAYAPDGKLLASASSDKTVRVWDSGTGKLIRALEGHQAIVVSVAFSPDGKLLASGSEDQTVRLWDTTTGKLVRVLQGQQDSVPSLTFSPDGQTLATGTHEHKAHLWDIASGKLLRTFKARNEYVTSVAFAPDGKVLACGNEDSKVWLWEIASGKLLRTLEGHEDIVTAVAYAPDGKTLVSGSEDGTVRLWDSATGRLLHTFASQKGCVYSVAYSPDGKSLVSGGGTGATPSVLVWDIWDRHRVQQPVPDEAQLATLWDDLAHGEGPISFAAMRVLIANPSAAVPLLSDHLPLRPVDVETIVRWVADLDDNQFAVREQATEELAKLGETALPILRRALHGNPSLDVRMRLDPLIEAATTCSPEWVRERRAVQVLELLGNNESRQLLQKLADGDAEARLTQDARAALARLDRQAALAR
jgi:WD40 repeat protein